MITLEQDIKQWADNRWPTRTLASRLRKLGEEVGELAEAVCDTYDQVQYDNFQPAASNAAREAADCAIILSDICSMLGYSLSAVMADKFAEVQSRPVGGVTSSTETYYGRGRSSVVDVQPTVCTCQGFYQPPNCPVHGRGSR